MPKISLKLEIVIMWLNRIDHIQVTSSPEAEDAMLFFYSKVLGLTEIDKPETIKDNGGAWYVLGDMQIHVSIEKNPDNATSRRHICYSVHDLEAFQEHLQKYQVEIFLINNLY
ncbi:VOC family protein [Chlorogloeopsis sp. ULAP01]|uniref:VOC family protein n=1 Tax=Chlorogloeopsis sp. ULAP01 TaxID=3056483 RepID=UPI0025AACBF9|nr:VOC family protein [Chlorogloeopsis sp. ULAP01]MDM9384015.1 VOC family protein [Chlorogloeopsis sp. ULAP01]